MSEPWSSDAAAAGDKWSFSYKECDLQHLGDERGGLRELVQ